MTFKKIGGAGLKEVRKIGAIWSDSKTSTFGAAVAYYTIFSIAPLLVISISIASLVLDKMETERAIISQFQATFGQNGAAFIEALVNAKIPNEASIAFIFFGFIVILVGATGIFTQLQTALNTIFENLPNKGKEGFWRTIRQKLLSFGMVLSVGFLLLASLIASTFISFLSDMAHGILPGVVVLFRSVELLVSFGIIAFFFALLYKFLPTKRLDWKSALLGGAITSVLFSVGKYVLGLYLGSSKAFNAFGGASALVLLIVWVNYMSQIFFLSAIITRLYSKRLFSAKFLHLK